MYKDPAKQKDAQHRHYLANKEKYKEKCNKHRESVKERRKQWFYDLKIGLSCIKCGENRTPCLEFHHREMRNGNKKEMISYLICAASKKRVLEAIKMCDVLCKNCHAMEHWDEENLNYGKLHDVK